MGRKSNEQLKKERNAVWSEEWKKRNMRMYSFRLSKISESDLIEKMESVPSKKDYIARLIREDIKRSKED